MTEELILDSQLLTSYVLVFLKGYYFRGHD